MHTMRTSGLVVVDIGSPFSESICVELLSGFEIILVTHGRRSALFYNQLPHGRSDANLASLSSQQRRS